MEDFDISHMSDLDEDDFLPKVAVSSVKTTKTQPVDYNPRDPAKAQGSNFTEAFGDLKKSEFYQEPEVSKPSTSAANPTNLRATAGVGRPVAAGVQKIGRSGSLLVSPRQRGNPLLRSITSVTWEFEDDLVADYVLGSATCALFLSLRYHNLNPDYLHSRLKTLGNKYRLRILLLQVDQPDAGHTIKQLNRLCLLAGLTLMLATSAEEAGKVLQTYKMFENKPADALMERQEEGLHAKVQNALTSLRCVNKTDAATLMRTFGSLAGVLAASEPQLELVPGFAAHKARTLHRTLHQPFLRQT